MRILLFSATLLFLAVHVATAQSNYDDPNTIATPSANNDLIKLQDFDVSLYTGEPNINVPLYVLPSKSLPLPISLAYKSTSGIRVQDVANFVGLGWRLNAGGYITRVVRGLPDEHDSGYIGKNLYGQTLAASGFTQNVSNQIGQGQFDGEPDLFTVSTPYFSFHFVLDQYGNPVFADNNGLKFSDNLYDNSNYKAGTWWVITDADGNQFYFGSTANSREDMTTSLYSESQQFTSTWYLDKIVSFNSKDVINLTYTAGSDYSVSHFMNSNLIWDVGGPCQTPAPTYFSYSIIYTYNAPKYINTISSSQGQVVFNYAFDRQDFTNDARLTSMVISSTANTGVLSPVLVKTYQFNYSYFGAGSTDPNALRLCLNSIQLYGNGTDPPLMFKSFDYNTTVNLPARNSVEFDYWGFYNTNATGTSLIPTAVKTPDFTRMQANILTAIHELSGAAEQFFYATNSFYNGNTNVAAGGLRIDHLTKISPSGESLTTQYGYLDANGHSTGQLYGLAYGNFQKTTLLYVIVGEINGQPVFCVAAGTNTVSESLYDSYDLNGNVVGYSWAKVTSPNGGYEIDTFTNYTDFPDAFINGTSDGSAYAFQNARQICTGTSLAYKRGLLLSKTVYTAANNPVSRIVNSYSSLDAQTGKAVGFRVVPYSIAGNLTSWVYGAYTNYVENYALATTTTRIYDENDPTQFRQTVATNTYAANHRLVHETDYTDSKGLPRRQIHYYTEDLNIPGTNGDEQFAISNLLTANNMNTLIHSVEVRNGTSLHKHNSYLNFLNPSLTSEVFLAGTKTFINNNPDAEVQQFQYDPVSCNVTAVNKLGGPFLSTMYGYNQTCMTAKVRNALNATSVIVTPTTKVDGYTFYPNYSGNPQPVTFHVDYAGTITLALNFVTTPNAETFTVGYTLSANDNSYSHGGNLCISTNGSCSYGGSFTTPPINPGTYQLTMTPQSGQNPITSPVNFGFTYPQFTVTQPTANEFYYEGFESYNAASTATPAAGLRYLTGSFQVPFTMPNSRSYQIDYHYLSNGVWYPMTKPYTNNILLTDGTAIDEVRVYPADAQMITYTYNPLVGITSKCDERNRFTFYDYDSFGRLKDTRDNDGHILKAYDYQYQIPE